MGISYNSQVVRKLYVAVTGVGLALSLAGYSWKLLPNTALLELPMVLGGIILSSLHLFLPRPDIVLDPCTPTTVRIAGVLCGTSGFLAAALIWVRVANRNVADIWMQLFQKNHVVVVGGGDFGTRFADNLARMRHPIVHAVDAAHSDFPEAAHRIQLDLTPARLTSRARLSRSNTIVIDMGTDTESMAQAQAVITALPDGAKEKSIAVHVSDPVLSDRFIDHLQDKHTSDTAGVTVFDENRILARHVLAERPLYPRAIELGQQRVHALIIGFGDLGEKIMDQVMLTSLARDLGRPRITIVDRAAKLRKREFCARRPRVLSNLDIEFIQFDLDGFPSVDDALSEGALELQAAEEQDGFTMIYVALPEYKDVTRTVLLLDRLQKQFGLYCAPISYRCNLTGETEDMLRQVPPPGVSDTHGFLRMSMPEKDLMDAILGREETDKFAIRIHEAYRTKDYASVEANKDWTVLPDTFKRANRRAGDHVQAKLATVGIRLETGIPLHDVDRRKLIELKEKPDNDPQIQKLAKLEHDRWCIDRFLDGWVFGEEDNKVKRTRRTLVPFEALRDSDEIKKDVDQVRELIDIILES